MATDDFYKEEDAVNINETDHPLNGSGLSISDDTPNNSNQLLSGKQQSQNNLFNRLKASAFWRQ